MKSLSSKKESRRKELILELFKQIEYLCNNPAIDPLVEHEQLEASLSKLIELEKDIPVQFPQRDDKWEAFTSWCTQQGVPMDKLDVRKVGDGEYGLFSKCAFQRNDVVLQVPRKMFLTNETALADPKLTPFLKDVIFARVPNLALAIHLLAEYSKGALSFWAPYLNSLPSTYSTVLYLSQAQLLQLKGSPLLEEVVKVKRNVARQFAYLAMKLDTTKSKDRPFLGAFTYELFCWALSTVMTRQNSVPSQANSEKWTLALIPLWDLCNHRQGNLCTDFDTQKDKLVFYSMSDLTGGDEIFNHYGDRKNADFFLNNGFVYEGHPNDTLRLKIGLSTADPLYELKEALCKKIDISPLGVFELAAKTAPANGQLLAFIRIFLLDKEQLEKWNSRDDLEKLFDEDCKELHSLADKVRQFISMRCLLLLRKYPPVEKFLNGNVERMVTCEKRILQSYST